jgi:integrase
MAGIKRFPNGTVQFVIKRAGLLEKPIYLTYPQEQEDQAREYVKKVEALLDRGIVPGELKAPSRVLTIDGLVTLYMREASPKPKDVQQLTAVCKTKGDTPLASINAAWVDAWVSELKRVEKLAPATIRAKVGALARCTDWGMRKGHLTMPDHPLRTLPDGYAQYSKADAAMAGDGREDVSRDRRLEQGEYERILAVLDAGVLPRKQRPLKLEHAQALRVLFILAVESAMRLREIYTLTLDQVDLPRRTVFLDKTKNGDKRQVPLSSVALAVLTAYIDTGRDAAACAKPDALFPWWDGSVKERDLAELSDRLSKLFHNNRSGGIFEAAGCKGLHFHDLRHEATSRLFERTTLSEMQIAKITGHRSMAMLARYANLRGSDLAARLW